MVQGVYSKAGEGDVAVYTLSLFVELKKRRIEFMHLITVKVDFHRYVIFTREHSKI